MVIIPKSQETYQRFSETDYIKQGNYQVSDKAMNRVSTLNYVQVGFWWKVIWSTALVKHY